MEVLGPFLGGLGGGELGVGNGSLSSSLHSITWANGLVTAPTNGKSYLIATAAFAALPGAPVPDVIIPTANVPFFDLAGDTIAFGGFDTLIVPAPVPTNGTDSYTDLIGVGPNTPKIHAGTEGSVNAAPPARPELVREHARPAGPLHVDRWHHGPAKTSGCRGGLIATAALC